MASVHLSYPCDHCSSELLLSVVCGDVGSSGPVNTRLKNVGRLAYDFFLKRTKLKTEKTVLISHPTHTRPWVGFSCAFKSLCFVLFPETYCVVTLVVLLKVNAVSQSPANGRCSHCRVAQMCRVHGGCQCPASALRMLSFGSPSTQGWAIVSLRPDALTTVLSVLT